MVFFRKYSISYLFIYLAAHGLSCGMWDLVPQPGLKPRALALRVQSPGQWTTRGVPQILNHLLMPPYYLVQLCRKQAFR